MRVNLRARKNMGAGNLEKLATREVDNASSAIRAGVI